MRQILLTLSSEILHLCSIIHLHTLRLPHCQHVTECEIKRERVGWRGLKVSLCVRLDMWVSVWVRVCVRSVCSVAHRAKTYLYSQTPTFQKPMTFYSILFLFSHHLLIPHLLSHQLFFSHHHHPLRGVTLQGHAPITSTKCLALRSFKCKNWIE